MSAVGIYASGKKISTWYYYDTHGNLIHVYNHSSDEMIFSSVSDSVNQICPFLGGIDRFYRFYFKEFFNIKFVRKVPDFKLIFNLEIKEGMLTTEKVSSTGTRSIDSQLEQLIQGFPDDWIQAYFDIPFFITIEAKNESNKLMFNSSFRKTSGK